MPVTLPEKIVRRRCAALVPYARNARTHSDQQSRADRHLDPRIWLTNPVLIDEEDGIIAGHVEEADPKDPPSPSCGPACWAVPTTLAAPPAYHSSSGRGTALKTGKIPVCRSAFGAIQAAVSG